MKRIENMSKKELSKIGIIKENNYYKIFNRRLKGATIKIIYPYGMDHSDYYIDFYLNSLVTFLDEHINKINIEASISYEIFLNKSVITIDVVDSFRTNILLGMYFNTISKDDLLNILLDYKMNLQYKLNTETLSSFNMLLVDEVTMDKLALDAYNDLINDTMDIHKIKYLQKNMINESSSLVVIESNQRHITLDTFNNSFFNINKRNIRLNNIKNDNLLMIQRVYKLEEKYKLESHTINIHEILLKEHFSHDIDIHIIKEIKNKISIFLYSKTYTKDNIKQLLDMLVNNDALKIFKNKIKLTLRNNYNKISTAKGLTNAIINNQFVCETYEELLKDEIDTDTNINFLNNLSKEN